MPQNEVIPIECFRCGVCCIKFQAPVDDDEISTVAAALGLSGHDFILTHLQDTPMGYLIRHGERGCTFLDFEKSSGLQPAASMSTAPMLAAGGRLPCQSRNAKKDWRK